MDYSGSVFVDFALTATRRLACFRLSIRLSQALVKAEEAFDFVVVHQGLDYLLPDLQASHSDSD
jgi:hypothetical protein